MLKEFKEFALKGNVLDLAIGVIIGASFGKIVTSLVTDIIMPPIGLILGGIDFSKLAIILKPATDNIPAVTINYGLFLNTTIDFLIIAFVIFFIVKQVNKFKKKEEKVENKKDDKKAEKISEEILLLREIRNSLKKK